MCTKNKRAWRFFSKNQRKIAGIYAEKTFILSIYHIFALPSPSEKREFSFFTHFPHGSKRVPKFRERQQGVTKNKLYNAKG